jgi:hypothetical protein
MHFSRQETGGSFNDDPLLSESDRR